MEIILGHKGKVVLLVGVFRCLGDTRIVGIEEDVAALKVVSTARVGALCVIVASLRR